MLEHKKSARHYCARVISVLSPQPFLVKASTYTFEIVPSDMRLVIFDLKMSITLVYFLYFPLLPSKERNPNDMK